MAAPCPSDDQLAAYAEAASDPDAAQIAEHVRSCAHCSDAVRRLRATLAEPGGRRAPRSPTYPPGTHVGRFVLERKLGEGGMGVVFVAHDPTLDRKVAIKLLHRAPSGSEDSAGAQARLTREAQAMAKLNHPNVVTIYEVGTHDDQVFLAMELVDGMTAHRWLAASKPTWQDIRAAFLDAGRGLAAAHAAGFVHRDFKPDNVLISGDGRVRVTDFGLARAVGAPPIERARSASETSPSSTGSPAGLLGSPITQEGSVVGTIAYMSPEQFAGGTIDPRSDVFSFCVALYEAFYGACPPREWETIMPAAEPPAGSKVPAWVHAALLRGMSEDPDARFPSMDALLVALTADPASRPARTSPTRWIVVGVIALALAGSATAWMALRGRAASDEPCDRRAAKLAAVWNDRTRAAIADAFARVGGGAGAKQWPYTERALDQYAKTWLVAGADACEARARGDQNPAATLLRLECLDNTLIAFRVLVEMLAKPDPPLIESSVLALSNVARPSVCADSRTLTSQPNSKATKAQLDDVVARLERAAVHEGYNDVATAARDLEQLLIDVRKLDVPVLEVQVLEHLASIESTNAEYEKSIAHYKAELELAETAHLDIAAATAASEMLADTALAGHPLAEVEALIEPTQRLLRRAGSSIDTQVLGAHALGVVYSNTGRSDLAVEQYRKVIDLSRQANGGESIGDILNLNNLGGALDDLGRSEEALAAWHEGLEVEKRMLGANRDTSAITWINLALTNGKLGRLAESEDAAQHVLDIATRQGANDFTAMALGLRAIVRADAGKTAEAIDLLAQSEALMAKLQLDGTPDGGEVLRLDIEAAVALGRHDHAVELVGKLLAGEAKRLPPTTPQWVQSYRAAGMAYVAAGKLTDARDVLDRALALSTTQTFYAGWISQIKYLLARALIGLGEQRDRAHQLCREAERELAALPVRAKLHAEVAAWCAAHER